jgi:hypothetical protein
MRHRPRSLRERINVWGATDDEMMRRLPGEEDLVGERVFPELQRLEAGDEIRVHPKAPALKVRRVEPPRVLALEAPAAPEMPAWGWISALERAGASSTRLLSRTCDFPPAPPLTGRARVNEAVVRSLPFDLVHMIMARKQMLSLRALAERDGSPA